jgi:hypothetical protein
MEAERGEPRRRLPKILTDEERRLARQVVAPYLDTDKSPDELAEVILRRVKERRLQSPGTVVTEALTTKDIDPSLKPATKRPWLRRVRNEAATLALALPLTIATVAFSWDTIPKLDEIDRQNKGDLCATLIAAIPQKDTQIHYETPEKAQEACLKMVERYDSIKSDDLIYPKEQWGIFGLTLASLGALGTSAWRLYEFGKLLREGAGNLRSNRRRVLPIPAES